MWLLATWFGRLVMLLFAAVAIAGTVAGVAYASDEAIDADVVSKRCELFGSNIVEVRTRLFGLEYQAGIDYPTCRAVPSTAFVQYHMRSGRTVVYESEHGACLYDSTRGPC